MPDVCIQPSTLTQNTPDVTQKLDPFVSFQTKGFSGTIDKIDLMVKFLKSIKKVEHLLIRASHNQVHFFHLNTMTSLVLGFPLYFHVVCKNKFCRIESPCEKTAKNVKHKGIINVDTSQCCRIGSYSKIM